MWNSNSVFPNKVLWNTAMLIHLCSIFHIQRQSLHNPDHRQGWAKRGLQLWVHKAQFILLLFIYKLPYLLLLLLIYFCPPYIWLRKPKYLLSGPVQKTFADPWTVHLGQRKKTLHPRRWELGWVVKGRKGCLRGPRELRD